MKPGPLRHRLAPALIASVLLHLAVAAWLWLAEPRVPPGETEGAKANLVELEFTDVPPVSPPPPKPPATSPASAPRPATRPVRKQKPAEPVAEKPRPAEPPPPSPQDDRPVAGAAEQDTPRKLVLVPSWAAGVSGVAVPAEPESRGRTLHPGDPAAEPESTAETSERLTARVQDWMDDGAAGARAGGIGKHPYFVQVRGSLEGALARTKGGDARQLGIQNPMAGIMKSYSDAAQEYARTGNPGGGPPSPIPLHSEKIAERLRDEPAARQMMMAAQARETLDALNNRSALLTVTLELRQARSGELLEARLTEASGNPRFDSFVLRVVPGALGTLTPPPEEALRGRDSLRTQWLVEGWLYTPKELIEAASSLASGQLLVPLDLLLEPKAIERSRFEYRARLLKVY